MSDDSEFAKYVKDSRTTCKYGPKCYQKNPIHRQKYKHPPNKNERIGHINKKIKIDNGDKETKEVTTSNDVSESDENDIEESTDTSNENCNQVSDTKPKENDNVTVKENDENMSNSKNESNNDEAVSSTDLSEVHISNDVSGSDDSNDSINVKKDEKMKDVENDISEKNKENGSSGKLLYYKQFIKEKFLVDMPEDFYQFWNYCIKIKPNNPIDVLKDVGLKLVGPFDVLAGKFDDVSKSYQEYLLHWRYYRDPPELQTVLKGDDKTGFHIGYFRDSPNEAPIFLAGNKSKWDGILQQMGPNIFTAVNTYLEDLKKTGDPFKRMHIGRLQSSIKKESENLKLNLSPRTDAIVARERKVVTRTFNKIGLVVPYNRKTQLGYRELALNNKELNALFTKLDNALPEQRPSFLSQLQPVFTYASIAADECDFGTGIELGWDIICHGVNCLNSTALRFLSTNYRLLNKETFAKIAEAHMSNRKKGCDLSII